MMIRRLVACFLAGGAAFAAGVPWVNLGPGGGGWIMSLAASPHDSKVVIAGGDIQGVFRSQDGGQNWTPMNTGLRDFWVEAILFHPTDPDVIFIGGKSGVYRSADGGQTWTWLRNGFPPVSGSSYSAPVGSLVADPYAPAVMYAGIGSQRTVPALGGPGAVPHGAQGAIYKTIDGGEHWFKVNESGIPEDALVTAVAVHPADTTHLYVSSNKGVYQSLDSGVTWTGLNAGLPHTDVRYLAIAQSNPRVLYATLRTPTVIPWRGGVYKSIDGGRTWVAVNKGLGQLTNAQADPNLWSQYYCLAVDPADERIVYAGTTDYATHTLFRSADGGATWLPVVTKPPATSFDQGWGLTYVGNTVQALAMSPLDSKLLYFADSMRIYKTPDAGASWQQLFTRRAGDKWQTNGLETAVPWLIAADPRNPSRLFLGYGDIGLFISEDGGRSFLPSPNPPRRGPGDTFAFAVALDPVDAKHIWAVLQEGGMVYESLDGGVNWTLRSSGLPSTTVGSASRRRRQILLDTETRRLLANVDGQGIYASTNGGLTWSPTAPGCRQARTSAMSLGTRPISLSTGACWRVPARLRRRCIAARTAEQPGRR